MPENERTVLVVAEKVDAITLEIEATTEKADKGIDKTIESLRALKTALNGIKLNCFFLCPLIKELIQISYYIRSRLTNTKLQ